MSEVRFPDVQVQLTGHDGNPYAVLATVAQALRRAGHGDQVAAYRAEATAGDYDHLLQTTMRWVDVT
jgi:prophage antirepressor-like protein